MKLAAAAPALLLAAAAYAHVGRSTVDVIQARQAKLRRDLIDVCASIDADLGLPSLAGLPPLIVGHLDVCLCISAVPDFCASNQLAKTAGALVGVDVVVDVVIDLINNAHGKRTCTLPAHGHSLCTAGDPCSWGCGDGYAPYTAPGALHPSQCYCPPPSRECNGKCGSFPHGCSSAAPAPYKRAARTKRDGECSHGRSVCGVPGTRDGWECVDTLEDKESCGGCIEPAPIPGVPFEQGRDCTAVPHVATGGVDCEGGVCFVRVCEDGYVPNSSHDGCDSVLRVAKRVE